MDLPIVVRSTYSEKGKSSRIVGPIDDDPEHTKVTNEVAHIPLSFFALLSVIRVLTPAFSFSALMPLCALSKTCFLLGNN